MYFGHLQYRPSLGRKRHEHGYTLIVLIFLMVGLMITALAMAPGVATQIKRDREQEMVHRGAQYARAVKKYYKKFGRYPPTLEALEDTNHMRFLRKRYKDPLTEDGKWQTVRFGQVQFNATGRQGGTGLTGGGTGLPNVPGVTGLLTGQGSQTGQQPGTSTFGGTGSGPSGSTTGGTFGSSNTGQAGSTVGGTFGQSTTSAGGNQPFGGGAIIGVSSLSEKESLRVVDDKNHYKDWKFVYDPTFDRGGLINGPYDPKKQMGQFPGAQQPGQQLGQPIGQQPSNTGFSNNPGASTFGQPNQSPIQQPSLPPDQPAPQNPR
jgi:type II secretory pathway pseudopilin PulG